MSDPEGNVEGVKKQEFIEDPPKNEVGSEDPVDDLKDSDNNTNGENPMPSPQQEEEVIKKKYGGLLPRKPPLISKDHERAYFDSADWALGKVLSSLRSMFIVIFWWLSVWHSGHFIWMPYICGHSLCLLKQQGAQKPKGPLEALRPKLQPTQQQARSRRSAYAPADDSEADGCHNNVSPEDQSATEDVDNDNSNTSQDQGCH